MARSGFITDANLKVCPFCGKDDVMVMFTAYEFFVVCLNCHSGGPISKTLPEASLKWNDRAHEKNSPSGD
jgi:Lar family restriction alleviation protein